MELSCDTRTVKYCPSVKTEGQYLKYLYWFHIKYTGPIFIVDRHLKWSTIYTDPKLKLVQYLYLSPIKTGPTG